MDFQSTEKSFPMWKFHKLKQSKKSYFLFRNANNFSLSFSPDIPISNDSFG